MTEKLCWLHGPVFTTKTRGRKKKQNRRGLAESKGRAVADRSTATPRGEMITVHVTKKIGTLHLPAEIMSSAEIRQELYDRL